MMILNLVDMWDVINVYHVVHQEVSPNFTFTTSSNDKRFSKLKLFH